MRTVNLAFDQMPMHLIDQYSLLEVGTTLGFQRYKFPIILDKDMDLRVIRPLSWILQTLQYHSMESIVHIAGERKGSLRLLLTPASSLPFSFAQQEFIREIVSRAVDDIFDGDEWGAEVHFTSDYSDESELIKYIERSFLYGTKECTDIVKNLMNTYPKIVEDKE